MFQVNNSSILKGRIFVNKNIYLIDVFMYPYKQIDAFKIGLKPMAGSIMQFIITPTTAVYFTLQNSSISVNASLNQIFIILR